MWPELAIFLGYKKEKKKIDSNNKNLSEAMEDLF